MGTVVRFTVRCRQLKVAVVIAALMVGPLALTGDGEVFALNVVGLGIGHCCSGGSQGSEGRDDMEIDRRARRQVSKTLRSVSWLHRHKSELTAVAVLALMLAPLLL